VRDETPSLCLKEKHCSSKYAFDKLHSACLRLEPRPKVAQVEGRPRAKRLLKIVNDNPFFCSAWITHRTGRLRFARVDLQNAKRQLVAMGQATFRIIQIDSLK
jgi:hypothetical protein